MASLETFPLQPPPPGQISNFIDPETRGPAVRDLCYIFIVLMWPIFLMRLYSKAWVIRKFGWDDGGLNVLRTRSSLICGDSLCHTCCSMRVNLLNQAKPFNLTLRR